MDKIKGIRDIAKLSSELKSQGKTIGLITGCFDIIHIGHILFFKSAKRNVDILIVGLDSDQSIKLSKGNTRPIYTLKERLLVLSELISIDFVFGIRKVFDFNSPNARETYIKITKLIKPNYLITNPVADRFWTEKKERAKQVGIKLLLLKPKRMFATSSIVNKLSKEI